MSTWRARTVISYWRREWSCIMSLTIKTMPRKWRKPWDRPRWGWSVRGGRQRALLLAGRRQSRAPRRRAHTLRVLYALAPRWVNSERARRGGARHMEYQHPQPIAPLGPPAPPPQLLPPAPPPPLPSLPQLQHQHNQDEDRWNQYHIWRQHVFVNGQLLVPGRARTFSVVPATRGPQQRCPGRGRERAVKKRESARAQANTGRNFLVDWELFS